MEQEEGIDLTAAQMAVMPDREPGLPPKQAPPLNASVAPQACGSGYGAAAAVVGSGMVGPGMTASGMTGSEMNGYGMNGYGMAAPSYVYVLGRVEPRFPTVSVEKEFAQAVRGGATNGLTNPELLASTLAEPANRYLARQLCWVLMVAGMETYILVPRDPADLDRLVESLRPAPSPMDIDVVIGMRGPMAPPDMCNGLMAPIVAFDQIYSFDRDSLIRAIPAPGKSQEKSFETASTYLFDTILQMADNAGATDEDRALNYLAVRYDAIYTRSYDAFANNFSLSAVEARPSALSGARNIVDVVFAYTHRTSDFTEKYIVRVDVTEEFPFLVSKLSPYFDR